MKGVGISLFCLTASYTTMSTCARRYPISVGKMEEFISVPQTTIQVLAAFTPDGYFNNKFFSKHKVVFAS
ncbi:hypothetical protein CLV42_10324 [Chitinophaga ginsengisoli]|uniref:Uncharacterized protein n=1 Tax=Chitinophaga ginsengisoli TaxID=363837 RepID=A0A2P8GGD4_9BACT|nr:hypothetical protein CLV42_10324 [Chitinophaga ginsengisoli]